MTLAAVSDPITAPTWITAITTGILAAGAIVTAIFAVLAFRKQSAEVGLIQQQLKDQQALNLEQANVLKLQAIDLRESLAERQRDMDQRHRAQASLVFICQEDSPADHDLETAKAQIDATIRSKDASAVVVAARVTNTSEQPVYDIAVRWHTSTGPFGDPEFQPQIMPGGTGRFTQTWTVAAGIGGLGVAVEFRDTATRCWRTTDRGELTELCGQTRPPPLTAHCTLAPGHSGPHSWEIGLSTAPPLRSTH